MIGSTMRLQAARKREIATKIRNGRMVSSCPVNESERLYQEARELEDRAQALDGKVSFHFHFSSAGVVGRVNVLDSPREYRRACDDVMCPHADADRHPA